MPGLFRREPRIYPTEGINSRTLQTIREIAADIGHLDQLKELLNAHARECLDLLDRIELDGVTDPAVAIDLLLIDEAARNLAVRRDLYLKLIRNHAIILLPLPPHLSDSFLHIAGPDLVFHTDGDLPPHLSHNFSRNLSRLPFPEVEAIVHQATGVVLEGYVEQERVYVRDTAANLLYIMSNVGLTDVFLHLIPHIPPRTRFVELQTKRTNIQIRRL